jgi:Beta-ketoacyl synthase, N-terminal domain
MADPAVAIVGLGAVFPGAGDAATFWRNICAGVDAITDVPPQRWDPDVYYRPGETGSDRFYCRRGGFIDDLATFEPTRFGVMPTRAARGPCRIRAGSGSSSAGAATSPRGWPGSTSGSAPRTSSPRC